MSSLATWKILQLTRKLSPGDTSLYADRNIGVTSGRLFFQNEDNVEWLSFSGVSLVGTEYVYANLIRQLSQTAIPIVSLGTGYSWIAPEEAELVLMHDQITDATTGQAGVYANAAARNAAITVPANGMQVYLTAEGYFTDYISGAWVQRATGATPNGSTTVAGKFQAGTQTAVDTPTDIGTTGALNVVIPSTFQAWILARVATELQAETGSSNTVLMTPLLSREANTVDTYIAWENISAGAPVYVEISDSKVYNADANVNNKCNVRGFALNTITTGNPINVKFAWTFVTTGLTANADYFLSDNVGTIQTTPWTNVVRVWTAISTTQLVIDSKTIVPFAYTIAAANASDNISGSGWVYTKYKEIVSPESGTYIVTTTGTNVDGGGGWTVNFRVYKNGVAYGTEQTIIGGAGSLTFVQNLVFLKWDLIQLYAKATNAANHTVTLLQIQGLFITPTYAVINNA